MERIKTVELTANEVSRQFEIGHAERLLKMKFNGGWALPKDSPYKFTEKDGLKFKSSKREDKKS